MSKPSTLPPSLRNSTRYIAFEIISEKPIEYRDVSNALWVSSLNFLGDLGASETKTWPIKNLYNADKQRGIIRCNQKRVEDVRAVLSLIDYMNDSKAIVNVLGVTGTIKSAKKKYLKMSNLEDFS